MLLGAHFHADYITEIIDNYCRDCIRFAYAWHGLSKAIKYTCSRISLIAVLFGMKANDRVVGK